jgi:hypothetical protein
MSTFEQITFRITAILAISACALPSFAEEWVPVYVSQLPSFTMDSAFADPEDTADPANFLALPSDVNTVIIDDLTAMLGDMPPLDAVFAALRIARGYKGEPCMPLSEFIPSAKASECTQCDIFAMLCRKQGIPAKEVVLWNCPEADLRLGAEVWIEERWHFFLPSEGFFFSKTESFNPDLTGCSVPGLTRLRTDSSLLRYGFSLDDSFVPMPVLNPDMTQRVAGMLHRPGR